MTSSSVLPVQSTLKTLKVLVLDETHLLLDMGFQQQLNAIIALLPKQRRTGLFSATQTEAVEALARAGLHNPKRINVKVTGVPSAAGSQGAQAGGAGESVTPSGLALSYVVCEAHERLPQLVPFLSSHRDQKCIVYFLTCTSVEYFATVLRRLPHLQGIQLHGLHGKLKQAQREATLAAFTDGIAGCLLCTDLAARGLDIPNVHWIVQYEPPQNPGQFVHRVGRTARMGRSGSALVYLLPQETAYVEFLRLRKVHLHEVPGEAEPPDVVPLLRAEAEGDREVMEKATRALVSFVRAYKEHHCKYIFRLQMKEVKKVKGLGNFVPSQVDPETVRFRDKPREKQQQALLKQPAAAKAEEAPRQQPRRQEQQQRQPDVRLTGAKRKKLQSKDEAEELAAEYALLRKLKRGKISDQQFDAATGLASDVEEDRGAEDGPGGRRQSHQQDGSDDSSDDDDSDNITPSRPSVAQRKAASVHHQPGSKGGGLQTKGGRHMGPRPGTVLHTTRLGSAIVKKLKKKKRKQLKERQQGKQHG